jgi:hypothetical protein
LCVVVASVVQDQEVVDWSEMSTLVWLIQPRLWFRDIHNPSLRFLHRWMPFIPFPMVELHSIATPQHKYLFAIVNRIKYAPVADIVDYFKNVHKMSGHIECASTLTRIAMNLGCPKMTNLV